MSSDEAERIENSYKQWDEIDAKRDVFTAHGA